MKFGLAETRVTIGLVQGLLLAGLVEATLHHIAPFNKPMVLALSWRLLNVVALFLLLDLQRVRLGALLGLLGMGVAVSCAVTVHAVHQGIGLPGWTLLGEGLFWLLIFIIQALGFAADKDRRWYPAYPVLFETAWDQGILLALAAAFTALTWGIVWLAAGLFGLVKLYGLSHLLTRPWVWPPVTCTAFASAIALCIERQGLVHGARRLVLSLLSALLPVLAWLAAAFLVSLIFVSLAPIRTSHLAGWLLSLATSLIILLLNALYQDGRPQDAPGSFLRMSGYLAIGVILPLVWLAIMTLEVRVAAHGWSPVRVFAAAGIGILGLYGVSYVVAALWPGAWLRGIAPANVLIAAMSAVIFLSLLTPIADPRRLAVASQVARLRSGRISADRFDYAFLARGAGRYGRDALARLCDDPPQAESAAIKAHVLQALAPISQAPPPATAAQLAANVTMHPEGASLPPDLLTFLTAPERGMPWIVCLKVRGVRCDAVVLPSAGDGVTRVVFLAGNVQLFENTRDGGWRFSGSTFIPPRCADARAALLTGNASVGVVQRQALVLGAAHFSLQPLQNMAVCGQ